MFSDIVKPLAVAPVLHIIHHTTGGREGERALENDHIHIPGSLHQESANHAMVFILV